MRNFIQFFNYFYISIFILWVPLQRYYLQVDGAGRIVFVLSVIVLLVNISCFKRDKEILRSTAYYIWMALLIFSLINSLNKGFISENGLFGFIKDNFFNPFVFLTATTIELRRDGIKLLKCIFAISILYLLIGYTNIVGDTAERMGAIELGNLLPLTAVMTMFISCVLHSKHHLSGSIFWIVIFLILLLIIASGTRKALGAYLVLFVGYSFSRYGKLKIPSMLTLALLAVIVYMVSQYIMSNTLIGFRIQTSAENVEVQLCENRRLNNFLTSFLGDRSIQYYEATQLFLANKWTGIGLTNYIKYVPDDLRLHTEYMVQLCENGIIGFALLMAYYFNLFRGMSQFWSLHRTDVMMGFFGLFAILFINFTAWTYNATFAMVFYAIILNYAYNHKFVILKK